MVANVSFKAAVHPKKENVFDFLKNWTQKLSGEVSWSTKHFWSLTAKQRCSILLNSWSGWRLVFKNNKQLGKKQSRMAPYNSYSAVSRSPEIPKCYEKKKPTYTVRCNQAWAPTSDGVIISVLEIVFSTTYFLISLESWHLWKFWSQQMSSMEPFYMFEILNKFPINFSCLGESCNAVLLWSSRNLLRTIKLHTTFYQHKDEWMMIETLISGRTDSLNTSIIVAQF